MVYFADESIVDAQCDMCELDIDMPCPILQVQLEYNYKQVNNPDLKAAMNILINEKGICQMRLILNEKLRRVKITDSRHRSLFHEDIGP